MRPTLIVIEQQLSSVTQLRPLASPIPCGLEERIPGKDKRAYGDAILMVYCSGIKNFLQCKRFLHTEQALSQSGANWYVIESILCNLKLMHFKFIYQYDLKQIVHSINVKVTSKELTRDLI